MAGNPLTLGQAAEAFRTFAVDAPYAAQTLRKKLMERRAEMAAAIAGGHCVDWAMYCRCAGKIDGLDEAIASCEDMMKQERQ